MAMGACIFEETYESILARRTFEKTIDGLVAPVKLVNEQLKLGRPEGRALLPALLPTDAGWTSRTHVHPSRLLE